jgi:RNA polymerase sigma-54 factor
MALEIRQHIHQELRLSQELVMTPQLQQAIKLLQLSRLELANRIQEEMELNPLLDEAVEEEPPVEAGMEAGPESISTLQHSDAGEEPGGTEHEIDWEQYLSRYDVGPLPEAPLGRDEERPSFENFLAPETTLQDHLQWQLRLSDLSSEDQEIGVLIVGNIDEDGYLRATVEEIAETTQRPPERVEAVLSVIQDFDPVGVGSRDLRECLLKQAREKDLGDTVIRVIDKGLKHLEGKNYRRVAKELEITFEEVVEAAKEIAALEPRPGRNFSSTRVDYVVPDVFVAKEGDEYVIRLNEDGLPKLRVSPYYQNLLKDSSPQGKEAKGYIQEKMQSALWLIKSIHQRQQTLYKVSLSIVKFQKDFFDNGVAFLRPLILRDVAEDIGMHESTVSRVTTGKYMHTRQGTLELKFFFSSAIQRKDGEDLASRSVKARIRELVGREEPQSPWSDLQIAQLLSKEFGLKIARRTVSKYRESMGILSSCSRKRFF